MSQLTPGQDRQQLRQDQYRSSHNLAARANLHRRYGDGQIWEQWVLEQGGIDGGDLLKCGCGPGRQWRRAGSRLPPDLRLHLTDLSAGMVREAATALRAEPQLALAVEADIQAPCAISAMKLKAESPAMGRSLSPLIPASFALRNHASCARRDQDPSDCCASASCGRVVLFRR